MDVSLFDFDLPEELIAQTPLADRSGSKLMVLNRKEQTIFDDHFRNIIHYLRAGDVLVLNNTRVLPARLFGTKADTGAHIEVLLLKQLENEKDLWEVLVKPAKRVKEGTILQFGDGSLKATCEKVFEDGGRYLRFEYEGQFLEILAQLGEMPLPPYIRERLEDPDRYQTVYAKEPGSAAAPTAGLHFTEELLDELKKKGVEIAYITLHVGLGTFRPVKVDRIEEHKMHEEYFEIHEAEAQKIVRAKQAGGRVIAVGTTVCRTLETVASRHDGKVVADHGWTNIFIYPGYHFKVLDGLVTNFHLPKSSLIMLVSAFADREFIMQAYHHAIEERYRFFSFGDAMLIL